MNKAFLAAVALLATGLAGCRGSHGAEAPPLAGAAIGGPFTLTDQDGHAFTSASLAGQYRVIYFGYTFCPDACPTAMQVLAKAMRDLASADPAKAARVRTLFITVDPARDTPAVLKTFVRAFSPTLVGLTGNPDAIARVAKDYAVFYQAQPPAKRGAGYLVQHQSLPILFGPKGEPIAMVPVDQGAKAAADTLAQWVAA